MFMCAQVTYSDREFRIKALRSGYYNFFYLLILFVCLFDEYIILRLLLISQTLDVYNWTC
jgi:hypothetical protein